MRIPDCLASLADYGVLDEVVRPLMSGKEAQVYLVLSGGKPCVAKVYKEAQNRTFKHRSEYTEGRKVRNSRDQRAIQKRSKHGRAQDEAAWRSTEVDMIQRLYAAGVRVPVPQHFIDGVLLMELITDANGNPAPRLADLVFDARGATTVRLHESTPPAFSTSTIPARSDRASSRTSKLRWLSARFSRARAAATGFGSKRIAC